MREFAALMPDWIGTVPAWGMFILMVMTAIKTYPLIQKNLLDAREGRESRYGKRISELEEAVAQCQRECAEQTQKLLNEIAGLRRNHIQEQISLVSAIIESVDNPLLKQLLTTMQSVQRTLPQVEFVGGVEGDANKQSE